MTPLEKCVEIAGSQTELARRIGVVPQTVQHWVSSNNFPLNRVVDIEQAVGAKVTRQELCPDFFGDPVSDPTSSNQN